MHLSADLFIVQDPKIKLWKTTKLKEQQPGIKLFKSAMIE